MSVTKLRPEPIETAPDALRALADHLEGGFEGDLGELSAAQVVVSVGLVNDQGERGQIAFEYGCRVLFEAIGLAQIASTKMKFNKIQHAAAK